MITEEQIKHILARRDYGKQQRTWWETNLWNPVIEMLFPQMGSMISGGTINPGEKRGSKAYDGTPESACDILVAGMHSGLTPDNYPWLHWALKPKELNEINEVKRISQKRAEITIEFLQSSNFHDETNKLYRQCAALGTGIKWREKDPRDLFRFQVLKLTECVLIENRYGRVDGLIRECKWTARNAMKAWGNKCSQTIKNAVESGNHETEFDFLMVVLPRDDFDMPRDSAKRDSLNMKYTCLWLDLSQTEGNKVMEETGFREFPASVWRWEKIPGDNSPYGRGPGIKALQDMGVLNAQAKTNAIAGEFSVKPPIAIPSDGFDKSPVFKPGSMHYYNPASTGKIYPINTIGNLPYSIDMQQSMRQIIKSRFYVDAFLMISSLDEANYKNVAEIMARRQEKLMILGPTLGTQKNEHLSTDMDWAYSTLEDAGEFPYWPDEVYQYGERVDPDYKSPLLVALERGEADAAIEVYQTAALISQAEGGNPEVFDALDKDFTLRLVGERKGAPMGMFVKDEARDGKRKARLEQQQQMVAEQQSMAAVEAAKNLGSISTHPDEPNALTSIVQGLTQQ